jgi:hypothetical protein
MRLTPPGRRIFRVAQFRVQARDVVFSSPSLRAAGFLNSAASRLSLSLDALLHLRRAVVLFEWLRSCLNTSLSFLAVMRCAHPHEFPGRCFTVYGVLQDLALDAALVARAAALSEVELDPRWTRG